MEPKRIVIEEKKNVCIACIAARVLEVTDREIFIGCKKANDCKEREDQTI